MLNFFLVSVILENWLENYEWYERGEESVIYLWNLQEA